MLSYKYDYIECYPHQEMLKIAEISLRFDCNPILKRLALLWQFSPIEYIMVFFCLRTNDDVTSIGCSFNQTIDCLIEIDEGIDALMECDEGEAGPSKVAVDESSTSQTTSKLIQFLSPRNLFDVYDCKQPDETASKCEVDQSAEVIEDESWMHRGLSDQEIKAVIHHTCVLEDLEKGHSHRRVTAAVAVADSSLGQSDLFRTAESSIELAAPDSIDGDEVYVDDDNACTEFYSFQACDNERVDQLYGEIKVNEDNTASDEEGEDATFEISRTAEREHFKGVITVINLEMVTNTDVSEKEFQNELTQNAELLQSSSVVKELPSDEKENSLKQETNVEKCVQSDLESGPPPTSGLTSDGPSFMNEHEGMLLQLERTTTDQGERQLIVAGQNNLGNELQDSSLEISTTFGGLKPDTLAVEPETGIQPDVED